MLHRKLHLPFQLLMLQPQVARRYVLVSIHVVLAWIVNSLINWSLNSFSVLLEEILVVFIVHDLLEAVVLVLSVLSMLEGRGVVHILLHMLKHILVVALWRSEGALGLHLMQATKLKR